MEKINITGVPETMLQTFYARAKESEKPNHKLYDAKAVEIVKRLDYDFSKADKDALMSTGVIARTILLDDMVGKYVKLHPNATVVNIACGLDTRFYRVDNGKIRWYNLDLPETIAVRKRFMDENGRVSMIACSAMDKSWADEIQATNEDVLVIVEGLSMYLSEKDVKQILSIIDAKFPKVTVYMEIMSPMVVGKVEEKSIKASKAKFTWGAKSGQKLEELVPAFKYQNDRSLVEVMEEIYPIYKIIGKIPFIRNLSNKISVLEKEIEKSGNINNFN